MASEAQSQSCSRFHGNVASPKGGAKFRRVWHDFVRDLGQADQVNDTGQGGGASPFDDEFGRSVLQKLRDATFSNGGVPELDASITWEEVHAAIRSLRSGKAAGPDGILADLMKQAGVGAETALTLV